MYFDTAIAGYRRALALPYAQTMESLAGDLYVRKATVEYHGSARYDDQLEIGMRCGRIGTSSILFEGAVFRGDELLINGELVYVFADPHTQTSRPVPPSLREVLLGFEAGQGMVDVRVGGAGTNSAAKPARSARRYSSRSSASRPRWSGMSPMPPVCMPSPTTASACRWPPAGCCSMPGVAKIGRMAVSQGLRGSGVGRHVLDALMKAARARGDREVLLHAQTSAAPFYLRSGFAPRGPQFEEAGIPHIEMVRTL